MNSEKMKILNMLADGKISADDASQLLEKCAEKGVESSNLKAINKKFLYVMVEPDASDPDGDRVRVKVPFALIRAGMNIASMVPADVVKKVDDALDEKGMDFRLADIKTKDMEELLQALNDLEVQVESGKETIRVYCE